MKIPRKNLIIPIFMLITGFLIGKLSLENPKPPDPSLQKNETWICAMHPEIQQHESGNCPICGMEFTRITEEEEEKASIGIHMSPNAMKLAQIQTAIVQKQIPIKTVRLSGKVYPDERLVFALPTHISGRIEKLHINQAEYVKKGQIIAHIYSPTLGMAQRELLEAFKTRREQPELFAATKEKLLRWKITPNQIQNILQSQKEIDIFPILSTLNGIATTKNVRLGDHVKQGQTLFEITDLSQVWILFDVHENDIPWIHKGEEITYEVAAMPGQPLKGAITFIEPIIHPITRVARARVVASNIHGHMKPEMFVSGVLQSRLQNRKPHLIVPASAVMWTGKRSVVYVKTINPSSVEFRSREVILGPKLEESYIILDGISEGEEIATHGTFNIDAAAQLAGKPSMMNRKK